VDKSQSRFFKVVGKETCETYSNFYFRVLDSRNKKFPIDSIVYALVGWRSHTVVNPDDFAKNNLSVLPDFGGLPVSLGIGYLGMPGVAAYFGLLEICKPKPGETVVVTSAAGSVGSLVGQIAKIKGCKVIGFTGSDDKCRWVEEELGFDKGINYKVGKLAKALKAAAPDGVDCFFDNVGGELSTIIINQMNFYGRIACCGAVSEYNCDVEPKLRSTHTTFILKQLSMEGFLVFRWSDRWIEGITQIKEMILEGQVKYRETITDGFENLPEAFIELLEGRNYGKAVLKV
jgi:prostaglandin reductase 1